MLNDLDIKKLEFSANVMCQAMEALIKKVGHSDLTLYLEGSYYDQTEVINKIKAHKENETKKKTYTGKQNSGKTHVPLGLKIDEMNVKTAKRILKDKAIYSDTEILAAQEIIIKNLQKIIEDKDKHIKRLNLDTQKWFDIAMNTVNKGDIDTQDSEDNIDLEKISQSISKTINNALSNDWKIDKILITEDLYKKFKKGNETILGSTNNNFNRLFGYLIEISDVVDSFAVRSIKI